jgi:DmsE family decaheme c-type cytochrome
MPALRIAPSFRARLLRCLSLVAICAAISPLEGAKNPDKTAEEKKSVVVESHVADPSQYVGSQECKTCHEAEFKSYDHGAHWKIDKDPKGDVTKQGCEGCHGPGKAHAEEGGKLETLFRFTGRTAESTSKQCLTCHEFTESHSNFLRSEHVKNGVGCVDCHSEHKPKIEHALLKEKQPQLCFGCHQEARADFSKPFHHRVNEGLIACSNCHNPHGGFLTRQLNATAAQDQVCFTCHSEKAGPFVFEHPPSKVEGCVMCHTPHGSTNPRLLKRSNVNTLCLECHTFTVDSAAPAIPTFHNQAQKYQACTMCHTQIHGSNTSPVFFR